jgi:hypothetical protein
MWVGRRVSEFLSQTFEHAGRTFSVHMNLLFKERKCFVSDGCSGKDETSLSHVCPSKV